MDLYNELLKLAGIELDESEQILLTEGIAELKRQYPNISDNDYQKLIRMDPTYKGGNEIGKFGRWILDLYNLFVKDRLAEEKYEKAKAYVAQHPEAKMPPKPSQKSIDKIEDFQKLPDLLSKFVKLAKDIKQPITTFKSVADLASAVRASEEKDVQVDEKARANYKVFREAMSDGLKVIYQDNDWVVGIPETYESSSHFKEPVTNWCTAYPDMYKKYIEAYGGKYYIFLNKHTGELYQLHAESYQFKNAADQEVNRDKFVEENANLKPFLSNLITNMHGKDNTIIGRFSSFIDTNDPETLNKVLSSIDGHPNILNYVTNQSVVEKVLKDDITKIHAVNPKVPNYKTLVDYAIKQLKANLEDSAILDAIFYGLYDNDGIETYWTTYKTIPTTSHNPLNDILDIYIKSGKLNAPTNIAEVLKNRSGFLGEYLDAAHISVLAKAFEQMPDFDTFSASSFLSGVSNNYQSYKNTIFEILPEDLIFKGLPGSPSGVSKRIFKDMTLEQFKRWFTSDEDIENKADVITSAYPNDLTEEQRNFIEEYLAQSFANGDSRGFSFKEYSQINSIIAANAPFPYYKKLIEIWSKPSKEREFGTLIINRIMKLSMEELKEILDVIPDKTDMIIDYIFSEIMGKETSFEYLQKITDFLVKNDVPISDSKKIDILMDIIPSISRRQPIQKRKESFNIVLPLFKKWLNNSTAIKRVEEAIAAVFFTAPTFANYILGALQPELSKSAVYKYVSDWLYSFSQKELSSILDVDELADYLYKTNPNKLIKQATEYGLLDKLQGIV